MLLLTAWRVLRTQHFGFVSTGTNNASEPWIVLQRYAERIGDTLTNTGLKTDPEWGQYSNGALVPYNDKCNYWYVTESNHNPFSIHWYWVKWRCYSILTPHWANLNPVLLVWTEAQKMTTRCQYGTTIHHETKQKTDCHFLILKWINCNIQSIILNKLFGICEKHFETSIYSECLQWSLQCVWGKQERRLPSLTDLVKWSKVGCLERIAFWI